MKEKLFVLFFTLSLAMLGSCGSTTSSEYKKMEEKELASGVREDSLFLGIYLGMTSQDFYDHCWKLNKQGVIMEGTGNTTVHYDIEEFKYPASMEFYPAFDQGLISAMPISFTYDAWSPWNKHLFSDKLIVEVLDLMKQWYGDGFIEIPNPNPIGSNAWVKVDGNRRISVYYVDDTKVKVDIVDLIAMKESEAARK